MSIRQSGRIRWCVFDSRIYSVNDVCRQTKYEKDDGEFLVSDKTQFGSQISFEFFVLEKYRTTFKITDVFSQKKIVFYYFHIVFSKMEVRKYSTSVLMFAMQARVPNTLAGEILSRFDKVKVFYFNGYLKKIISLKNEFVARIIFYNYKMNKNFFYIIGYCFLYTTSKCLLVSSSVSSVSKKSLFPVQSLCG